MRLYSATFSLLAFFACPLMHAQAPDGALSQAEVDALRDTAYQPVDRVKTYIRILDDREKEMGKLLAKRHGADFAGDVHDLMDQISGIADELNDNLDSYNRRHRDLRKVLLKLIEATEKWSTTLRSPEKDARYEIVRKSALDAVKDTKELAGEMQVEQAAYFRSHPEEAKVERQRAEDPHAPR